MRRRRIAGSEEGSYQARVDIQQAYQTVSVHPEDHFLLSMAWEGSLFVDTALLFGLRSVPKIFMTVADALEWQIKQEGLLAAGLSP